MYTHIHVCFVITVLLLLTTRGKLAGQPLSPESNPRKLHVSTIDLGPRKERDVLAGSWPGPGFCFHFVSKAQFYFKGHDEHSGEAFLPKVHVTGIKECTRNITIHIIENSDVPVHAFMQALVCRCTCIHEHVQARGQA